MNVTSLFTNYLIEQQETLEVVEDEDFYNTTYNFTDNINSAETYPTFDHFAHLISSYYTPFLALTGSIGNILSVLVFFKTKLRKLSSSYYLAALGISDTCFLVSLIIPWLTVLNINIYHEDFTCKLTQFVSTVCSFLSVWFVVAFTVERFIAVLYPLKRQTMCTVKRAKIVLCVLTILGMVHSSPTIIFSSSLYMIRINQTVCNVNDEYKVSFNIN